jgi:hypothetical protein
MNLLPLTPYKSGSWYTCQTTRRHIPDDRDADNTVRTSNYTEEQDGCKVNKKQRRVNDNWYVEPCADLNRKYNAVGRIMTLSVPHAYTCEIPIKDAVVD